MILLFSKCCCFKNKPKTQKYERLFAFGEEKVKKELNLFTMLESIMKIKASLAVLVDQHKDKFILMKIQDQYLQNALIQLD